MVKRGASLDARWLFSEASDGFAGLSPRLGKPRRMAGRFGVELCLFSSCHFWCLGWFGVFFCVFGMVWSVNFSLFAQDLRKNHSKVEMFQVKRPQR